MKRSTLPEGADAPGSAESLVPGALARLHNSARAPRTCSMSKSTYRHNVNIALQRQHLSIEPCTLRGSASYNCSPTVRALGELAPET